MFANLQDLGPRALLVAGLIAVTSLSVPKMATAQASAQIIARIPIAPNADASITVNPGLNKIYVSGNASGGQVVQAIDGVSYSVSTLGAGSGASVDTATNNVWAAGVYGGNALVYSGSTGALIQTVPLSDCPVSTSYDPIAGRAWIGAQCGPGNDPTYAVNGTTYAIEAGPIGTGGVYGFVVVNPDTGRAYVLSGAGSLRINPNNSFAQTSNAFGNVGAVDVPNNLLFAIPVSSSTLQIINGAPDPEFIQQSITLSFAGDPNGMAVNPTSGSLYLSNASGNSIAVVNEFTGAGMGQISLGAGNTSGALAIDATRNILYAIVQTGSGPEVWVLPLTLEQPVGTTSSTLTATVQLSSSFTLGSISVVTQGAPNLDFKYVSGGSCTVGNSYTAGETCTVDFTFTPTAPGTRMGAIDVYDNSSPKPVLQATVFLNGIGIGPLVNFMPGTQSVVANAANNGLEFPFGVTVDASGNVYIADKLNNRVLKETLSAGSYAQSVVANNANNGLDDPYGVAVDGSGNVYIADTNNDRVLMETLSAGSYTQSVIANFASNGLYLPVGVAADGSGNVYIADPGSDQVLKETLSGGSYTQSVVANSSNNGLYYPEWVAVDGDGSVYIADTGNGSVLKETLSAGSYTQSVAANAANNGLLDPEEVAVDSSGNVYIADSGNSRVLKETLSASSYTQSVLASSANGGLDSPQGVAVDGSGNVYIADSSNSRVLKEDFADPPSLTFAPTAVGSTSSNSPQTVTVENIGNATLNFLAIGFPADFPEDIAAPNDCSTDGSLAAGASCTLAVNFEPKTLGALANPVVLVDNSLNETYAVQYLPVSGTGLATQAITFTDSLPASANYSAGLAYTLSATGGGSGNPVTFSLVSGPATLVGSALTITGTGTVVVAANQAGNATYAAAPQVTQSITIKIATQTINFPAIAGTQYAGTQITLSATASSGLAVSFASQTPSVCTVAGATASLLTQGTCIIRATQAGSATWAPAVFVQQNVTVHLNSQAINFPAITATEYILGQLPLSATASSGLAVSFASATSSVCTVAGTTASLIGLGTCVIHATQAGSSAYSPAPLVSQSFVVHGNSQTISFPAITGTQYALTQLTLSATATSGLTVSFASTTPSVCTVAGTNASLLTAGTCILRATQAGNADYSAATLVQQNVVVHLAPQTINFPAIASQKVGANVTLSATASSGLTVSFSSATTSVCSVSGTTATMLTTGTCVIHATQGGNNVYSAAPLVSQSITVKTN